MKKYDEISKKEVYICNAADRWLRRLMNVTGQRFWMSAKRGYFSKWDGCIHRFQLCENCYGKMIQTWCYLPDEEEQTEWI